jgi:hypothetical protein
MLLTIILIITAFIIGLIIGGLATFFYIAGDLDV